MAMTASFLIAGFLLNSMFRYINCFESYWEEVISLRNYLPDSDSDFIITIASNIFACMSNCLMTDGCYFISYIAITSECVRHHKWLQGYQLRNSSCVWNPLNDDGCPYGWYRFETSCFFFPSMRLSWNDSVSYCPVFDAQLAELDTQSKDAFVRGVVQNRTDKFWIGGSDSVAEGTWVWTTSGSPMTYTNWYPRQPDNYANADCLCLGQWFKFAWDDCRCSVIGSPVCQKPVTYKN